MTPPKPATSAGPLSAEELDDLREFVGSSTHLTMTEVARFFATFDQWRNAAEEVIAAAIDSNETLTRRQSNAIGQLERVLNGAGRPTSTGRDSEGRPGDRNNSPEGKRP